MVEKAFVPKQNLDKIEGVIIAAFYRHGLAGAQGGAPAAGIAPPAVDLNTAVQGYRPLGAGAHAIGAADAVLGLVVQLGSPPDAFGVMAPDAGQGAAFEEDGGADTRAIVQGIAMDVENQRSSPFRVHGVTALR